MGPQVERVAESAAQSAYNAPMKVLFLHGWQSVPGGVKVGVPQVADRLTHVFL
jgi:hypothetical protein